MSACKASTWDESDSLWILDPAAPMLKETVKGGPKLVKVDLVKNEIVQTIPFSEQVAPKRVTSMMSASM